MRPVTMVVGIVLGSSAAIALGLAVVLLIYLLIGGDEPAMQREIPALWRNALIFVGFTALSALSFYAQIKEKRWASLALASVVLSLAALITYYWP